MNLLVKILSFSILTVPWASDALAQRASAVTLSPDGAQVLINKDVESERWVIARNRTDGSVTGGIFDQSGGPVNFLWCFERNATDQETDLACLLGGACTGGICADQWSAEPIEVTLPTSFFGVPGEDPSIIDLLFLVGAWQFFAEDGTEWALEFADVQTPDGLPPVLVGSDVEGNAALVVRAEPPFKYFMEVEPDLSFVFNVDPAFSVSGLYGRVDPTTNEVEEVFGIGGFYISDGKATAGQFASPSSSIAGAFRDIGEKRREAYRSSRQASLVGGSNGAAK